jgi:DNA polymerase-3 subunit beta
MGGSGKEDAGVSGEEEGPTIGLSIGDHDVTFTAGAVKVSTRLLDGSYPDYRQLIPAEYPNRLHVGKDSLLDALRRVRLLVRDNTTPVRLSMRSGGVDLTVVSQEVGDASETVDADFDGSDLTIAFNPTYLIDGVEAVSGDEVLLETVDATKPATVRAAEEANFRYLLMPVRVS